MKSYTFFEIIVIYIDTQNKIQILKYIFFFFNINYIILCVIKMFVYFIINSYIKVFQQNLCLSYSLFTVY